MNKTKIVEVLDRYERRLQYSVATRTAHTPRLRQQHLLDMIPQMREFLADNRREKLMRWLGFVQGALWVLDVYTIEEMKEHNRPARRTDTEGGEDE